MWRSGPEDPIRIAPPNRKNAAAKSPKAEVDRRLNPPDRGRTTSSTARTAPAGPAAGEALEWDYLRHVVPANAHEAAGSDDDVRHVPVWRDDQVFHLAHLQAGVVVDGLAHQRLLDAPAHGDFC